MEKLPRKELIMSEVIEKKRKITFEEAYDPMAQLIARKIINDIRKKYEEMNPEETARINQLKKELNFMVTT